MCNNNNTLVISKEMKGRQIGKEKGKKTSGGWEKGKKVHICAFASIELVRIGGGS